jgi:uncharacterized protein YuzE
MRYKYDPKTDILVITLGRGKLDFGEEKSGIITHYDKNGKPLEIEILNASKTALEILTTLIGSRKMLAVTSN